MASSVGTSPTDRVQSIERELTDLKAKLRQTATQVSFLQILVVLFATAVGGGGYYLVKEGMLRIEGFSPPVEKAVNAKDFGYYNRANTRTWFASDDKFGDPEIIFLNPKKQLKMRLKVWPDEEGGGGLVFYDSNGNGWRGEFRMGPDGVSTLNLRGDKQQGGIDLAVAQDGSSSLKMFDKSAKGGIDMGVDVEGNPKVTVTAKDGSVLWKLPSIKK